MAAPVPAPTAPPVMVPQAAVIRPSIDRPTPSVATRILIVLMVDPSSSSPLLAGQPGEEVLHPASERDCAVADLLPGGLRLGLGGLAGLLDLLARRLGSFHHGLADTLR